MKKEQLEKVLTAHAGDDYHFTGDREYHEPVNIMDVVREVIDNAPDDEMTEADDLRDQINESADSATPVYNHDRAKWFEDNWQAYDDVTNEFGKDGMGDDIMIGIGIAYCVTLEREAMDTLGNVWAEAEELENSEAETENAGAAKE